MTMEDRPFYWAKEVAQIMGVKHKTVLHWIYQGKIPARKLRGRWIVLKDELEAYFRGLPRNGESR